MVGLGNVKTVVVKISIYLNFVQKFSWYFLVKSEHFAKTDGVVFDRHQLLLASKIWKMIFSAV